MKMTDNVPVGKLVLDNRLAMPPMALWMADNGAVTEGQVNYYAQRAGKMGLITMEYSYISREGKTRDTQVAMDNDGAIGGLKKITDAVHARGTTKIIAQINHAGRASGYEVGDQADIDRIVEAFASAALRSKQAGFDGVELHASHGYLLNQFYSPLANFRTDRYGAQNLENRTRLTRQVIGAVRQAVGGDYLVSVRFGGCDYQPGGSTIADAVAAAKLYELAGADMLSISGGMNGYIIKDRTEPGWFSDMSGAIRAAVSIPVLLTGGIRTKADAERLLAQGAADLIGVGRPLLKSTDVIGQMLEEDVQSE